MNSQFLRLISSLLLSFFIIIPLSAQSNDVLMVDYGPEFLDSLFVRSDYVGMAEIQSGSLMDDGSAWYHAKVIQHLKGDTLGSEIEFGRFIGYEIGKSYLFFLHRDSLNKFQIMLEGDGAMPLEYNIHAEGSFDDSIHHVIKVCSAHVTLPYSMRTFPVDDSDKLMTNDALYRRKFVVQNELISYLKQRAIKNAP